MKQRVDILSRRPAIVVLMNAMCKVIGDKENILTAFGIDPEGDKSTVTVEVLVNGVPVPFIEAMQEGMDQILADLDKEVKAAALELLQSHPTLMNLQCELENAEWRIKDALDSLTEEETK